MKTSEEIKRGLKLCSHEGHGEEIICEHCPYDSNSCAVLICTRRLSADALAYIQQLETENHQLLTKAQQLESTISQVSKALCGKEKATLKELLQAADQLKDRAHTIEAEPVRHGRWIDGMPYTGSHWKVCSKCHKSADHPAGGHEYCGHCGTKMDGGAE